MAHWIWTSFGVLSGVARGMGVLDGSGYRQRGRGSFGVEFWASHCNQWGHCCVVERKCVNRFSCRLKWSMGSVAAFGGSRCHKGKGQLKGISPHWFQWHIFTQKCIWLVGFARNVQKSNIHLVADDQQQQDTQQDLTPGGRLRACFERFGLFWLVCRQM